MVDLQRGVRVGRLAIGRRRTMWGDDEGGEMVWDGRVRWGGVDGVDGCEGERAGGRWGGGELTGHGIWMKEQLRRLRAGLGGQIRKQYDVRPENDPRACRCRANAAAQNYTAQARRRRRRRRRRRPPTSPASSNTAPTRPSGV